MEVDPREEALRESAAVGNIKNVQYYLARGVNINSQNRVNKWTALHWAAKRDHPDIVRLLLAHEADTTLLSSNGERAADMAKGAEVRQLLNGGDDKSGCECGSEQKTDLPFVPNYLAAPSLALYSVPMEEQPPSIPTSVIPTPTVPKPTIAEKASAELPSMKEPQPAGSDEKELLVYRSERNEAKLLGVIFVPPHSTISDTVAQISNEIDEVPSSFLIQRHTGARSIPINAKQMEAKTWQHFRGAEDAVIVIPK